MMVPVVHTRIMFPEKDVPNLFGEYPTRDMEQHISCYDDPSRPNTLEFGSFSGI